jgi:hypothetical protein
MDLTISGPSIKPVQGWPLAGRRVVGLGEVLETLSKLNPTFDTFPVTMPCTFYSAGGNPYPGPMAGPGMTAQMNKNKHFIVSTLPQNNNFRSTVVLRGAWSLVTGQWSRLVTTSCNY